MENLWSPEDLGDYLGVSKATVYSWRYTGRGPQGIRIGKHLRFDPAEVRRWLDEQATNGERRAG